MMATLPRDLPQQTAPTHGLVLIGLTIAFGWPLILLIPGVSDLSITNILDDAVNIGMKWLVVAGLCLIAFRAQRRPLSDFGIRSIRAGDLVAAVVGVVVGVALSGSAMVATLPSLNDVRQLAEVPVSLRSALVVTAGVCEEFIYRGFAVEELTFLTGKRRLSAVVAWAFFTLAHARPDCLLLALIVPGTLGGVLTVLYLWRRNVVSCALTHVVVDALFLLILPAALKAAWGTE